MQLISINIGQERNLQKNNRLVRTGIFKTPTEQPVKITRLGLERDVVMDAKYHGGPDQAVYIYGTADYDWWREQLGREIPAGTFGENLTISELESARFNVGDFLRVGDVTLQVSSPRFPCGLFATRMNDPQWVKKFRDAERPGLYCRVMQEGFIKLGDEVSLEPYQGATLSILQMCRAHYQTDKSEDVYRLHLNAPIDIRTRREMEDELQRLLQSKTGQ